MMTFGLRRRLGLGLATLVALALCGASIVLLVAGRYQAAVDSLDRDTVLARRARQLGVFAREQYIHEAHTIILGDRSHVAHHGTWVETLRTSANSLAAEVAPGERQGLSDIVALSTRLQTIFASEILPAIDRHDPGAVHEAHEEAEEVVDRMIADADRLGARFEARARDRAQRAERDARVGMLASIVLAAIAALVALEVARRVWRGVAGPLDRLHTIASRVSAGDTAARVGALETLELDTVGVAFDQMLDRLARRKAELVNAERLAVVGRIAAGVAHEINNPIGVIRGYLKTMLADVSEPALRAELCILDEEALACQRIAEDLLTYARIPALHVAPTEVSTLVAETVAKLKTTGDIGQCEVRVDIAPATLEIDPLRMRQVLTNLLRNGAQAMGGAGRIDVSGRVAGDSYELTVGDDGPGIAAEMRASLFEPFATNRSGGTGLGLAVCDGIVRTHGGEISVADRPEGGSLFTLKLPAHGAAVEGRAS